MNENTEYTIFDAIDIIGKKLALLIILPIFAGILAVAIGFAMPKWYRAETQILPPYSSGESAANLLGGVMGGIMGLGGEGSFTLPFMTSPTDLWAAMVKSNGIADSIIAKFDLKTKYHAKNMYFARKRYISNLYVDIAQEGILTIGYQDKSPVLSADITNEIVSVLDRTLREVHVTTAKRTREFLQNRLAECEKELKVLEDSLIRFQNENKAISLADQAKVAVENVAQLYAQLSLLDVQIGAMQNNGIDYSPELMQYKSQASELRRKISSLENKGDTLILGIPLNRYPDLIIQYARIYRDVKIQEVLYEMLRQQYEQAKIEEQRNTSTLHIISSARPPEKKYRPKKALMGAGAIVGMFIFTFLWILFEGYLQKLKKYAPEKYNKISALWRRKPRV
ncbi:hypothetical protein J7L68_07990 [bacterium]|nr:hypothetical protein [bacterium]